MSYEENRVRVKVYGSLSGKSPFLVPVASVPGKTCRLHVLAAEGFAKMAEAIKADLGLDLAITSGWRPHRWKSREDYEKTMIAKYGSVAEGKKWMAFNSPHETGLAMDIGVGGLTPNRKTASQQRETDLHEWLVEHAFEYGWHPYKKEPWHWEYPLDLESYRSGLRKS